MEIAEGETGLKGGCDEGEKGGRIPVAGGELEELRGGYWGQTLRLPCQWSSGRRSRTLGEWLNIRGSKLSEKLKGALIRQLWQFVSCVMIVES